MEIGKAHLNNFILNTLIWSDNYIFQKALTMTCIGNYNLFIKNLISLFNDQNQILPTFPAAIAIF